MTFGKGSILKKLTILVLCAITPVLMLLISNGINNRNSAIADAEKDTALFLSNLAEIQARITESTKSTLATVASMPDIRSANIEKSREILENLLEINSIYTNVILLDIYGNVIAAGKDHEKAVKLNFTDRKQFQEAIAKRSFSPGEFVVGKSTHKQIFPFGIPVLDDNHQPVGAIIVGVSLSHYGDLFKRGDYATGSFLTIFDHKGIRLFRYPENEKTPRGKPVNGEIVRAAKTSRESGSLVTEDVDQQKKIFVFEPISLKDSAKPYMYMSLATDYSALQQKADAILKKMVLTGLISLIVVVLIARYLAEIFIVRKMQKLTEVTREFSQNRKQINTGIDYKDGEIGLLAKSFDEMTTIIANHNHYKKQAMAELRASEQRFREIIGDVEAISIQGYDINRKVTFWNKASQTLYGYSREEALGKRLEDLIIPEPMKAAVISQHTKWLEEGQKIPNGELVLVDKDGNDVPVFSSHIMTDQEGKKEMFCIDIDLRPYKQSEREREFLARQLQQAQKMEAIGTLAGGIAHDFNNILYPILGHTEMLLDDTRDGEEHIQNSLKQIYSSTLRAKELVQQILTFSRQENPELSPVKLVPIIKEVLKLIESTFPKHIEIREKITRDCRPVLGNPIQIHQIIMNLTTNALHAIGQEKGTISLELSEISADKIGANKPEKAASHYVLLKVSDTGEGIAENVLDKIFDPFFTTKEQGKGTGMGLSVVHGLVSNMNGSIFVDSTPGKGTSFEVYLPVNTAAVSTEESAQQKQERVKDISERHILIVDDEISVLKLLEQILIRNGYRVTSAENPIEALDFFTSYSNNFDLVLTDISMPEMSGVELAEKLQEIAPNCPVIICTGHNESISEEDALEKGITKILLKPIKKETLLQAIDNAFSREKSIH